MYLLLAVSNLRERIKSSTVKMWGKWFQVQSRRFQSFILQSFQKFYFTAVSNRILFACVVTWVPSPGHLNNFEFSDLCPFLSPGECWLRVGRPQLPNVTLFLENFSHFLQLPFLKHLCPCYCSCLMRHAHEIGDLKGPVWLLYHVNLDIYLIK